MASLYGVDATGLNGIKIDANARKLVGDGASGVGPYTRFGTPTLQAIKVVSSTINFSTTYTATNSNYAKAIAAIQERAEIYYAGIPGNTGTGFTVLINVANSDAGDGYGASSAADGTYDNLEERVDVAVNGSDTGDITITNVVLSGLTFA
jgi:hypothetical protein